MRFLNQLYRKFKEENFEKKLLKAGNEGDYKEAKKYVKKGANVNVKCDEGVTALMWASYGGHIDIVKLLIESGADVNAKNKAGYTALMLARPMGHLEISRLLKEYGADE